MSCGNTSHSSRCATGLLDKTPATIASRLHQLPSVRTCKQRRHQLTVKLVTTFVNNQVTFNVPLSANKPAIRAAVEELFKVKVKAVNTIRQQGKVKRFRGMMGKRPDYKKAIVTLEDGHTIDVTTGL